MIMNIIGRFIRYYFYYYFHGHATAASYFRRRHASLAQFYAAAFI